MKKAFFAALAIALLCACASHKTMEYGFSANVFRGMQSDTMTVGQIDSMVTVDALPALSKWQRNVFIDEAAGCNRKYYTLFKKSTGVVYTVKELSQNELYYTVKKSVGGAN